MTRPYIICHMTTSIDGKVTGEFLVSPDCIPATDIYYEMNRNYKADAFACGRVTMEGSFTGGWYPDLSNWNAVPIPRTDHIADPDARFFAVAFDRHGRLGWKSARIEDEDPGYGGAHIIEVLCEDTADAYLAYLQEIGVSYIFAGETDLDLSLALSKLKRHFGIRTLLLEGGSILNGAFQRENVIDELSLVAAPLIADAADRPLFTDGSLEAYSLQTLRQYQKNVIWMNYKMNPTEVTT